MGQDMRIVVYEWYLEECIRIHWGKGSVQSCFRIKKEAVVAHSEGRGR